MNFIGFLKIVKQSNIPKAVTVFQKHKPSLVNANPFNSFPAHYSSSSYVEQFKSIFPNASLFNVAPQRAASSTNKSRGKRSKRIEISVPEPPKHPMGAYQLFFVDNYDKIKTTFEAELEEKAPPTQVMTHIGKMWRALPESEAKVYKERSKELSEKYKAEKAAWKENLTPLQEEVIRQQKVDQNQARKERKLKKMFKETDKPERPKRVTAINLMEMEDFDTLEEYDDTDDAQDKVKKRFTKYVQARSEKWRSLPNEEKLALKEIASEQNKTAELNYHKRLAEWALSMYDENNLDFLTKEEAKIIVHQLGIPKRRRSALQIFLMSDLGKEKGATVSTAKTIFDGLSSVQREDFNNQSTKDKERYEQEFKEWMDDLKGRALGTYAEAILKKSRAVNTTPVNQKVKKAKSSKAKKSKTKKEKSKKKGKKGEAKKTE